MSISGQSTAKRTSPGANGTNASWTTEYDALWNAHVRAANGSAGRRRSPFGVSTRPHSVLRTLLP